MPERLLSAAACAEIAARAATATAGPWGPPEPSERTHELTRVIWTADGEAMIAQVLSLHDVPEGEGFTQEQALKNAAFIAAAREDIPALLATVAALRGTVRELLDYLPDSQVHAWDWGQAWEELQGSSQDAVKEVRRRAAAVYEATR